MFDTGGTDGTGSDILRIDVSKDQADVPVHPTGQIWTIFYDGPGDQELVSQLNNLESAMVLLETTDGLELPMTASSAG